MQCETAWTVYGRRIIECVRVAQRHDTVMPQGQIRKARTIDETVGRNGSDISKIRTHQITASLKHSLCNIGKFRRFETTEPAI